MRVVLADDEPLALERLAVAFEDVPGTQVVATARNGVEALDAIARLQPDLAVLDIQMPGRSGLGVAADIPADRRPEIIFLTAFEHHAVDAFDVEAADYLLKPLRLDRLRQAVDRVRRRREGRRPVPAAETAPVAGDFWVQGRLGLERVPLKSIEWIEAAKDYVLLHTAQRSHILRATMAALEERLDPGELMRVHRSAFVRPEAVREFQPNGAGGAVLILADGVAVPVGPSYMPAAKRLFSNAG
jgi:DNA-binding LytR/AlgR family response regulator